MASPRQTRASKLGTQTPTPAKSTKQKAAAPPTPKIIEKLTPPDIPLVKEINSSGTIVWNEETEPILFRNVLRLKPVGPMKHWRMLVVRKRVSQALDYQVSSHAIWNHLSTLFDMKALDEMETADKVDKVEVFSLPKSFLHGNKKSDSKSSKKTSDDAKSTDEGQYSSSSELGRDSPASIREMSDTPTSTASTEDTKTPAKTKKRKTLSESDTSDSKSTSKESKTPGKRSSVAGKKSQKDETETTDKGDKAEVFSLPKSVHHGSKKSNDSKSSKKTSEDAKSTDEAQHSSSSELGRDSPASVRETTDTPTSTASTGEGKASAKARKRKTLSESDTSDSKSTSKESKTPAKRSSVAGKKPRRV